MKTFFLFLSPFIFLFTGLHAQDVPEAVLLEEDFESGIPGDWITEWPWEHGNSGSLATNSFLNNFPVPGHSQFPGINDDRQSANTQSDAMLITPVIYLAQAVEPVVLTFDAYYPNLDFYGDEQASVLISTDGMQSWEELYRLDDVTYSVEKWERHGVQIGEDFLGHNVHLAFHYSDDNGHNTGLAIDNVKVEAAPQYMALAHLRRLYKYPTVSASQYRPFEWEVKINNLGLSSLNGVTLKKILFRDGNNTGSTTDALPSVASGSILTDTARISPEHTGAYRLFLTLSEENIEGNLFSTNTTFAYSDSELAQDDGSRESSLGFGFGDPNWYGYYGTVFQLDTPDTLIGISVGIASGSGPSGSINFIINTFDESGSPTIEQYHSEMVELNNTLGWQYHELPEPMPLDTRHYLFAAGQDTIQGIVGFNFDYQPGDGNFWLISPVAGGGYPWEHAYRHPYRLMIRPHFKVPAPVVETKEPVSDNRVWVRIWPNPASSWLNMKITDTSFPSGNLRIFGSDGRLWMERPLFRGKRLTLNVESLPSGLYILEFRRPDGARHVQKLIKQ